MATDSGPADPNEKREDDLARGRDMPNVSEADQWGEKLNPVRETPVPFGSLNDGGGHSG